MTEYIEDQTINTYDAIAADYLARWHDRSPLEAQFKHFVSMLAAYKLDQLPILDVGCGPGFDTVQFRNYSLDVIGLDLSWQMLETGKRFFPGEFVQADMRHLPFCESFGGLWISASLLHIPGDETANTLAELTRLLTPGGLMYLSVKEGVGESWKKAPYNRPRFFSYWQPEALDGMLKYVGLQILDSWTGIGSEETWLVRFARKSVRDSQSINLSQQPDLINDNYSFMITIILLIRHGITDWNIAGRWQGHTDIPLNDDGREQARKLAQRLAEWPIKAIYTSDLLRAQETAILIATELKLTPIADANFRERNGGIFQGLTTDQLNSEYGDIWRKIRLDGSAPPNGESMLEVGMRAFSSFEKIRSAHLGETVAIVSHGGTLNILISHIIGLTLGQPASISLRGNTGLSIVEIDDTGPRLTLLNDVSHLTTGRKDIESGFSMLTSTE